MRTVAVIPVHGRLELLCLTIQRLLESGFHKVICLGSTQQEHHTCTWAGADFYYFQNKPVARKLNAGFQVAYTYHPDAVMYLSSSDWISRDYLDHVSYFINDYDMIGRLDCNFAHVGESVRAVHWRGYPKGSSMDLQTVGIGRVLSRRALDEMDWRPFDDYLNSSLDYSMTFRLMNKCSRRNVMIMTHPCANTLSVSTDLWSNIHSFHQLAEGAEPRSQQWLENNYPEIFTLKTKLYGDQTMPKMSLHNRDQMCQN
jgi:hypothetical protein